MFTQVERWSPQHHYRPRHIHYGAKMRASVRMTRYLESWGAAKPFANLHHRDSMTNENGKISTAVSISLLDTSQHLCYCIPFHLLLMWYFFPFCPGCRMYPWDNITFREDRKGKLSCLKIN